MIRSQQHVDCNSKLTKGGKRVNLLISFGEPININSEDEREVKRKELTQKNVVVGV